MADKDTSNKCMPRTKAAGKLNMQLQGLAKQTKKKRISSQTINLQWPSRRIQRNNYEQEKPLRIFQRNIHNISLVRSEEKTQPLLRRIKMNII